MNRAEFEAFSNRIAAVEARCELLEAELKALKSAPLEAMVQAEQDRTMAKANRKAGTF